VLLWHKTEIGFVGVAGESRSINCTRSNRQSDSNGIVMGFVDTSFKGGLVTEVRRSRDKLG